MYSAGLTLFSLEEFERIMLISQLLPSQRLILEDISLNVHRVKAKGLCSLHQVATFSVDELNLPEKESIKNTKQCYEALLSAEIRKSLSVRTAYRFPDRHMACTSQTF
jgi:hypothetical protein